MSFVDIKLADILDSKSGNNKYTQKYISLHPGAYPVYSAKTTEDMTKGFIDTYDYEKECIQITSNGANAGTVIYRPFSKFSVAADTRIYTVKEDIADSIDIKYICYIAQTVLKKQGYSWLDKAGKEKVGRLLLPIPVFSNGKYDIEEQKRLAGRYEFIDEKKAQIQDETDRILGLEPDIKLGKTMMMPLKELVSFTTVFLNMTQKELNKCENEGEIPVYSAGASEVYRLRGVNKSKLNNASEKRPVLSLATNGDGSAGRNFIIHTKPFGITADRIVLHPLSGDIDVAYLRYQLNNIKTKYGFNREHKALKPYIQDIPVLIPVRDDGTYDLERQQKIANKYRRIEQLKKELKEKVDTIINTSVIIE